jgi:hypothetical protein
VPSEDPQKRPVAKIQEVIRSGEILSKRISRPHSQEDALAHNNLLSSFQPSLGPLRSISAGVLAISVENTRFLPKVKISQWVFTLLKEVSMADHTDFSNGGQAFGLKNATITFTFCIVWRERLHFLPKSFKLDWQLGSGPRIE